MMHTIPRLFSSIFLFGISAATALAEDAPGVSKIISSEETKQLKAIRDGIGEIKGLDQLYQDRKHPNGLPYHIYIPKQLKAGVSYPLVTFLHGHTDLTIDTHKGFPKGVWSLPEIQQAHPHILFVPRHRNEKDHWAKDEYRAMTLQALDDFIVELNDDPETANIDVDRLYLTGFSRGGQGTWNFIRSFPNKFAAAIPLSGFSHGPQNSAEAEDIKHIPTWIFNGDGDRGVQGSRISFKALHEAGASDVRYHEYQSQGHVIDDFAYFTPGFMDWLFAQKKLSQLQIARIFSDHAVLQQGVQIPIWGQAEPGARVTVAFAGQSKATTAGDDGAWSLELAALQTHSTGNRMTVTSGGSKLEIRDLLVGEVWYASGQSNMQMTLAACAKRLEVVGEVVAASNSRLIRTVRIDNPDTEHELDELPAAVAWQIDTAENRRGQSAAAFFFARELHDALDVPIGIIESSWGGKPIEGFIPRQEFENRGKLKPILDLADAGDFEKLKQIEGGVIIRNTAGRPGRIFHSRIAPIAPYAVKGFIWYQGESNAGTGEDPRNYRHKMEALVAGWRLAWKRPELPFYFVQLPAFDKKASGWIQLREEQRLSLDIPNTGMAVTIDLRDSDIHPSNKIDVGKRLALWALAESYGKPVPFSGPLFRSANVKGNLVTVSFDHAGDGLVIARKEGIDAPVVSNETPLAHFELSDEAGKWHAAEAHIRGSTVEVHCPSIAKPIAVRYAWQAAPENANLYNSAGLPASPFYSNSDLRPLEGADREPELRSR